MTITGVRTTYLIVDEATKLGLTLAPSCEVQTAKLGNKSTCDSGRGSIYITGSWGGDEHAGDTRKLICVVMICRWYIPFGERV